MTYAVLQTLFVLHSPVAFGQTETAPGIAVVGFGEVVSFPNVLEVDLLAMGEAELTADAMIKFRDNQRRIKDAFDALKMTDLEVVEKSVSFNSGASAEMYQQMMRGMPNTNPGKPKISVGAVVQLRIKNIHQAKPEEVLESVSKLLDTARDTGSTVGATHEEMYQAYRYGRQLDTSMVRFVLEDDGTKYEEAYKLAVEDARKKAERLAKLNEVKVGPVIAIQDLTAPNVAVQQPPTGVTEETSSERRIISDRLGDVKLRVKLAVRFGIEK